MQDSGGTLVLLREGSPSGEHNGSTSSKRERNSKRTATDAGIGTRSLDIMFILYKDSVDASRHRHMYARWFVLQEMMMWEEQEQRHTGSGAGHCRVPGWHSRLETAHGTDEYITYVHTCVHIHIVDAS